VALAAAGAAVYLATEDEGDDEPAVTVQSEASADPAEAADPAVDAFFAQMRETLTSQLVGPEAVDCILARLRARLTPAEIADIDAHRAPKSLLRDAPAAGDACGRAALAKQPG
jgi:hypothetical protein